MTGDTKQLIYIIAFFAVYLFLSYKIVSSSIGPWGKVFFLNLFIVLALILNQFIRGRLFTSGESIEGG